MKKYDKVSSLINVSISLLITIPFFILCNINMKDFFIKKSNIFPVASTVFTKIIYFPVEGDYVLQIKYDNSDTDVEVATLNRYRLEVKVGNNSTNDITSRYYYIPKNIIRKRNNILKIRFYPVNPRDVDVRIKNYLTSGADDNIILTLKGAMAEHKNLQPRILLALGFFIFSFLSWNILMFIEVRFFELSLKQSIIYNCISFSPITFLLVLLGGISFKGPYVLVFTPQFIFILFMFITICSSCVINVLPILVEFYAKIVSSSLGPGQKVSLPSLVKDMAMWIYLRRFSEKLILLFMLFFIFADILYNTGLVNYAEGFSATAFCLLIAGIVLSFVSSMKERE